MEIVAGEHRFVLQQLFCLGPQAWRFLYFNTCFPIQGIPQVTAHVMKSRSHDSLALRGLLGTKTFAGHF